VYEALSYYQILVLTLLLKASYTSSRLTSVIRSRTRVLSLSLGVSDAVGGVEEWRSWPVYVELVSALLYLCTSKASKPSNAVGCVEEWRSWPVYVELVSA
jgi:hypothetical protein